MSAHFQIVSFLVLAVFASVGGQLPKDDGLDDLTSLACEVRSSQREVWYPAAKMLGQLSAGNASLASWVWDNTQVNSLGIRFVKIQPGDFSMGPDRQRLLSPWTKQRVRITQAYWISVTEVTVTEFQALIPIHISKSNYGPEDDAPVLGISWSEADDFCKRLSRLEEAHYRLPTEAEWEYACRAGSNTLYSFGEDENALHEFGWCAHGHDRAARVAMLRPNAWGIYDMHGNALEWVSDWYAPNYGIEISAAPVIENPQGPSSGWKHVSRGGAWSMPLAISCSSTARFSVPLLDRVPFDKEGPGFRELLGFRIVRECEGTESASLPSSP